MQRDEFSGIVIEDKYSLGHKIGEGGMGAVYLGTQLMVDRPVAIKLLHTGLNTHERLKQRFEVEAKAIGRLNHPNCITLYDFGFSTELDAFYTVMEYLDGEAMHKRVIRGVSVREAVNITRQIAAALDHAHHQGILHRDLKPENIILAKLTDGTELAKVLDFGIARIFRDDSPQSQGDQNRLTRAGEVFGTPAYISPEQARGERDLSPASDLYSLGIMLFEMVEGRLPFWGDTAIDTIMLHIQAPIPPITRLDVPPKLKEIIQRLMAKDPAQRYQTGRHLAEDLKAVELLLEQQRAGLAPMHPARGHDAFGADLHQPTQLDLNPHESREWSDAPATVVRQPSRQPFQTVPPPAFAAKPPVPSLGVAPLADMDGLGASQELAIQSVRGSSYAFMAIFLVFFLGVAGLVVGYMLIFKDRDAKATSEPSTAAERALTSTGQASPRPQDAPARRSPPPTRPTPHAPVELDVPEPTPEPLAHPEPKLDKPPEPTPEPPLRSTDKPKPKVDPEPASETKTSPQPKTKKPAKASEVESIPLDGAKKKRDEIESIKL